VARRELVYREHRLVLQTQGRGWVVFVYTPGLGTKRALDPLPYDEDPDAALEKAKRLVDASINP
jgi:hypothetical protein